MQLNYAYKSLYINLQIDIKQINQSISLLTFFKNNKVLIKKIYCNTSVQFKISQCIAIQKFPLYPALEIGQMRKDLLTKYFRFLS